MKKKFKRTSIYKTILSNKGTDEEVPVPNIWLNRALVLLVVLTALLAGYFHIQLAALKTEYSQLRQQYQELYVKGFAVEETAE